MSAALAALRLAKEVAKNRKDADLSEKLQDAYDRIADIRHQIFSLEDENRSLGRENEELKESLRFKGELVFDGQLYWRVVDGDQQGPYCPNCWHGDKQKLVPLQHQRGYPNSFYCTIHRMNFGTVEANPKPMRVKPFLP